MKGFVEKQVTVSKRWRIRYWKGPAHGKWSGWFSFKPLPVMMFYKYYPHPKPLDPSNPLAINFVAKAYIYKRTKAGRYEYAGEHKGGVRVTQVSR